MTDQPQPVRIYKLGPWPRVESPAAADATPLGKRLMAWLNGQPTDLDADLSRVIFREFIAQETYRQRTVQQLSIARQRIEAAQQACKAEEPQPNGARGAFAHGFSMGERKAFLECAQLVQDALNGATDAVAEYAGIIKEAAEALGDARNGEPESKP